MILSFNGRARVIEAVSTYDAAAASPQILTSLTAERRAVGIAESPIWEFIPCSRIIDLASAHPSFIGYVAGCDTSPFAAELVAPAGVVKRSESGLVVRGRQLFSRPDRFLLPTLSQLTAISLASGLAWPGAHPRISKIHRSDRTLFSRLRVPKLKPRIPPSPTRRGSSRRLA